MCYFWPPWEKKRNKAVIVYNAFGSSGPGCVGLGNFPCLSSFLCHWLVLTALAPRMLCILPSAGDYWPNSLLRFASEGACCRNCLHCGLCLLVGSLLTVTHAWGEATWERKRFCWLTVRRYHPPWQQGHGGRQPRGAGMVGSYSLHLSRPDNKKEKTGTPLPFSFFVLFSQGCNPWDNDTHIHSECSPFSQPFLEIPSQAHRKVCPLRFLFLMCLCVAMWSWVQMELLLGAGNWTHILWMSEWY